MRWYGWIGVWLLLFVLVLAKHEEQVKRFRTWEDWLTPMFAATALWLPLLLIVKGCGG